VFVLGVDGGGTKTEACLAGVRTDGSLEILGQAQAGPGNPRAAGFPAATEALRQAMAQALHQARIRAEQVEAVCLAVAGAGRDDEQQRLAAQLAPLGFSGPWKFVHDGWAALAAAFADTVGIAVISGTGSFAFGRNMSGTHSRAGGWGFLLGDEGSGYQLAVAALRSVARAADGRGSPTQLTAALLTACQLSEPSQLIGYVHHPDVDRECLARLAPLVLQTARDGDPAAEWLVRHAATELVDLIALLVDRLGFPLRDFPLGLAGGMLAHHADFRQYVLDGLLRQGKRPDPVVVVSSPVQGAVRLAARMRQGHDC
jgi:N-acetylglucosamine kinase-like BadF-type ATPase